jgi:hypothetical protein
MADPGLMFACFGCCCGHTKNGATRFARPALRRQYDAAGLQGRVRLAFSECLHGRPLYFRRINTPELFDAVLAYTRVAADTPAAPLPPELAERSFSWTGGGVGPEP